MRHDEAMSSSMTRSKVIRLAELTVTSSVVRDQHFEDCLILGPAIVALTGNGTLDNCSFEGDADAILWEISPTRPAVIGVIELANCDFHRCKFQGVGFAGPAEFVQKFRANVAATVS